MSSSFLYLLVLVCFIGTLLAAWAGIRSIQSARSVVFYRTRKARMMAGRQWLALSLALALLALGSLFFGQNVLGMVFSPAATPTPSPARTLTLAPLPTQAEAALPSAGATQDSAGTSIAESTATTPATPSRTPSYLGTYTAFAITSLRHFSPLFLTNSSRCFFSRISGRPALENNSLAEMIRLSVCWDCRKLSLEEDINIRDVEKGGGVPIISYEVFSGESSQYHC